MTKARDVLRSRGNPQLARWRRLTAENGAYRRQGQVWVEGEHLCAAAQARRWPVLQAVVAESARELPSLRPLLAHAGETTVVADDRFRELSALESPSGIAYVLALPDAGAIDPAAETVVLDRVQDAGNVGNILRSAAALGAAQVLATVGTAALWSAKVLRAGMGAHFALRLVEGLDVSAVSAAGLNLVATTSHGGERLADAALPSPCAWVFGHEGQGVADELMQRCQRQVRIPQPGGEESLNVAAAAAICLYERLRRRGQ